MNLIYLFPNSSPVYALGETAPSAPFIPTTKKRGVAQVARHPATLKERRPLRYYIYLTVLKANRIAAPQDQQQARRSQGNHEDVGRRGFTTGRGQGGRRGHFFSTGHEHGIDDVDNPISPFNIRDDYVGVIDHDVPVAH